MNELDTLVRELLLRFPTLFQTRFDVLRHLYLVIGNGYEWIDGRLVEVMGSEPGTEDQWRAEFFRDLDEIDEEATYRKMLPEFERQQRLRRARRQFQLDHVDDIVHEQHHDFRVTEGVDRIIDSASTEYSLAFTVPDAAEESFRHGAEETLREIAPLLYHASECGTDKGLRSATLAQIRKLRDQHLVRGFSGSPAGESEGWTRKTWPGARKADTAEDED